jgi:replicative DNA helicase
MPKKITLPSNVEAERCVLGIMLSDDSGAAIGLSSLTEDSFSDVDPRNKLIFRAIVEVSKDPNTKIEPMAVGNALKNMGIFEQSGGTDYIFELINSMVNPDDMTHYVKIIKDLAVLRDFLLKMNEIEDSYAKGGTPTANVGKFISESIEGLEEIANRRSVGNFEDVKEVAKRVGIQIDKERSRGNKHLTGVDTGYERLNRFTHGWQKGDLIVIAARPSVGKTAFALNLAYNAALHEDKTVAFFSCEMSNDLVMKRLCSCLSMVNSENIQTGDISAKEAVKVHSALDQLQRLKIYFDDTPNPYIGDIEAKAVNLKATHEDLCLIIVDYLNIIGTSGKYDNRAAEVGTVTKSLKQLARTLRVPIIVLAQLNRDVDKNREIKGPTLANLKESGSIEQDADMVILMYRPDYYRDMGVTNVKEKNANSDYANNLNASVNAAKASNKDPGNVSVVTFSLAKNRNGKTGEIMLLFSKNYCRFDTPSNDMQRQVDALQTGAPAPITVDDE